MHRSFEKKIKFFLHSCFLWVPSAYNTALTQLCSEFHAFMSHSAGFPISQSWSQLFNSLQTVMGFHEDKTSINRFMTLCISVYLIRRSTYNFLCNADVHTKTQSAFSSGKKQIRISEMALLKSIHLKNLSFLQQQYTLTKVIYVGNKYNSNNQNKAVKPVN